MDPNKLGETQKTSEDKPKRGDVPPLVSLKITNPATYIKLWWKKLLSNEGIYVRIRIKPLTTLILAIAIIGGSFGAGILTNALRKVPVVRELVPVTPSPNPWKDTAFSGTLRKVSENKYYLETSTGQAISLVVPENMKLEKFIGKKIFSQGRFHVQNAVLEVLSAQDIEVAIVTTTIPTQSPTPTPDTTPTQTPAPTQPPTPQPTTLE